MWFEYSMKYSSVLRLLCVLGISELSLQKRLKLTLSPLLNVQHQQQEQEKKTEKYSSDCTAQHKHSSPVVCFWKKTVQNNKQHVDE